MKSAVLGAIAFTTLNISVNAASADGLVDATVAPGPTAPSAESWTGFRVGLTFSAQADSETRAYDPGPILVNTNNLAGDEVLGGFIGYDRQFGNVVVGAEVQTVPQENYFPGSTDEYMTALNSARLRLGIVQGQNLFFGSIGVAETSLVSPFFPNNTNGPVVGIGFERKLGKGAFAGIAYDVYRLSGEDSVGPVELDQSIVQARVGVLF